MLHYPLHLWRLKYRHLLLEKYIVPYNPWLIKNSMPYVYEGHDAASVRVQTNDSLLNNDEYLTFLDGRYISASEAMWRLNEFSLSEKSHVGNHEIVRSLAKPTASGKTKW
ncbi:hypothetical protein AVEN_155181-1 [Araneus ventricosus]|uniref:Uncharacterized protein n=1 Tax=Araneus ventricosus TaxID=182803 RepID=A0A4Y2J0H1_ARAVE|nr:hypothetical protein AVEN_155181-1 [Araneus ventricosus]